MIPFLKRHSAFLLSLFALLASCDLGIRPVVTPLETPAASTGSCDTSASPFGGGAGTLASPYQICTRAHLAAIAGAYLASNFIQMSDIDLGGAGNPWNPIAATYTGVYDGNSKTISNLFYNTAAVTDIGLFKRLNTGAVIKNLNLTGVSITATGARVGGLVARLTASTIQNCTVSGTISGGTNTGGLVGLSETASTITSSSSSVNVTSTVGGIVGGLVGSSLTDSTITSSYATGTVTGNAAGTGVGGLVGVASGTGFTNQVSNCYATGNVTSGVSDRVGGLVGGVSSNISITGSYATGNVSGVNYVGGLLGYGIIIQISSSYATGTVAATTNYAGGLMGGGNTVTISKSYATGNVTAGAQSTGGLAGNLTSGTVTNSYATGTTTGDDYVAGLVGACFNLTTTNSYAVGLVTANAHPGGLVGDGAGALTNNNSYWDTQTTGQAVSLMGTGHTTAQMIDNTTFATWDFATIWNGAGFGGSAAVYPYLR